MHNQATNVSSLALLIHKVESGPTNNSSLAVMAHDVYHQGGQSVLGAGRPFNTTDKQNLLDILAEDTSAEMEFLEARCLASGKESLMWYRPRQKTTMDVCGKDYTVPLPSLIFLLHKGTLYVTAYKGDKRPEPTTRLLQCGLPNIGGGKGSWCSGGNGLPNHPTQAHIDRIEEVFFLSPFTHFNGASADLGTEEDQSSRKSLTPYFELLQTKRQFPTSKLKPITTRQIGFGYGYGTGDDDPAELNDWFKSITKD